MSISVVHHTDPGCPWAYSAEPHLRALEWRYGDGLEWRTVLIGLTESAEQYVARGYTGDQMTKWNIEFRDRFHMPYGAVHQSLAVVKIGALCSAECHFHLGYKRRLF